MFVYLCRCYENTKPKSLATPCWATFSLPTFRDPSAGSSARVACSTNSKTAKLLELRQRIAELEASDNPFALIVLAHLYTKETKHDQPTRRSFKLQPRPPLDPASLRAAADQAAIRNHRLADAARARTSDNLQAGGGSPPRGRRSNERLRQHVSNGRKARSPARRSSYRGRAGALQPARPSLWRASCLGRREAGCGEHRRPSSDGRCSFSTPAGSKKSSFEPLVPAPRLLGRKGDRLPFGELEGHRLAADLDRVVARRQGQAWRPCSKPRRLRRRPRS